MLYYILLPFFTNSLDVRKQSEVESFTIVPSNSVLWPYCFVAISQKKTVFKSRLKNDEQTITNSMCFVSKSSFAGWNVNYSVDFWNKTVKRWIESQERRQNLVVSRFEICCYQANLAFCIALNLISVVWVARGRVTVISLCHSSCLGHFLCFTQALHKLQHLWGHTYSSIVPWS